MSYYLLENPWPVACLLGIIGLVLLLLAIRRDQGHLFISGLATIGLGLVVMALATLVTTSREHGIRIADQLIDAAELGDVPGATALFDPGMEFLVTESDARPSSIATITSSLESLAGRNRIESNFVTRMEATSPEKGLAIVEFDCLTRTAEYPMNTATSWLLHAGHQPDGTWRITRLVFVEIDGKRPNRRTLP